MKRISQLETPNVITKDVNLHMFVTILGIFVDETLSGQDWRVYHDAWDIEEYGDFGGTVVVILEIGGLRQQTNPISVGAALP